MLYSSLVDHISGKSAEVWAVHYEAMARRKRCEDILILSLGQESNQYTPSIIKSACFPVMVSATAAAAYCESAYVKRMRLWLQRLGASVILCLTNLAAENSMPDPHTFRARVRSRAARKNTLYPRQALQRQLNVCLRPTVLGPAKFDGP